MKEFLSKRLNLLIFVTIGFSVIALLLTIVIPNYLSTMNINKVRDNLKYLTNNHTEVTKVDNSDRLYIYKDGASTMLIDVGYVSEIDPAIEVHLIHWSEDQTVPEVFYQDDFQQKEFVYYIEVVEPGYYVVAFSDTSEINDFISDFRLYSIIFVVVMYIVALVISSTTLSTSLIKKYSFYDPISVLQSKIAFFHRYDKGALKKYYITYHRIYNIDNIIDSCGIRNSDAIHQMIKQKLLMVFSFNTIFQLSDGEFIILSITSVTIHELFLKTINKISQETEFKPYEFRVKSVIVEQSLLSSLDSKTLISRIQFAFSYIKNNSSDITFVDQDLLEKVNQEIYFQSRLQEAIKDGLLENYYQIKVNPDSNKVVGAEALSRWVEDGEVISPSKYIHIAEASGLIYDIDLISFENACKTVTKMSKAGIIPKDFRLSTNFSPLTLNNINIKTIEAILERTKANPKNISIEITENETLEFEKNREVLSKLVKLGLLIEIDDFSAGNSSFAVLPLLNASTVKFDMAILPKSIFNDQEVLVYDSLISISKKIGLSIISEGVETQEQVDYLTNNNIHGIQGYFYSKPVAYDDFAELLKKYK